MAIAEEILGRYADLLRVGRLDVNGSRVTWDTDGSAEQVLDRFDVALRARMRQMHQMKGAPAGSSDKLATAAAACSPPGVFGTLFSLCAMAGSVRAPCARSEHCQKTSVVTTRVTSVPLVNDYKSCKSYQTAVNQHASMG